MATTKGKGIIFGIGTLTGTIAGLGSISSLAQGLDYSKSSDKEETRDADGDVAAVSYYNEKDSAVLDWVVSSGSTAAITVTQALSPGATLALTDSTFTPISATWLVADGGSSFTFSNTGALRARVNLEKYVANSLP